MTRQAKSDDAVYLKQAVDKITQSSLDAFQHSLRDGFEGHANLYLPAVQTAGIVSAGNILVHAANIVALNTNCPVEKVLNGFLPLLMRQVHGHLRHVKADPMFRVKDHWVIDAQGKSSKGDFRDHVKTDGPAKGGAS